MTRLRGSLIAAAVPLFLIGACAQPAANGAGAPDASLPSDSLPPAGLVLRTESYGGFVPPDRVVGALPSVSVYADGRVITEGPVPAIYPGPALPNVQVTTIDPAQVQALVTASGPAGVRTGTDFGQPNVADAPNTRVTVRTASGTRTVSVMALNEAQPQDPNLTPEQVAARTKLSAYVKSLSALQTDQAAVKAYAPESLAVLARPWTDPGGTEPAQPAQKWPGTTALPGDYLNANVKIGCVILTGAEKDTVLKAATSANAMTPWTAGSAKYLITFRPLLPDETDCAVLKGKA